MKSVNLLPADLRGTDHQDTAAPAAPGGTAAYCVLGALAVAVLALAGSVLASNSVEQRRAELAAVNQSQAAITRQIGELKPYADHRDLVQSRVASVRQLADSRFDWERALRDVSRTMPEAVTLESIDASLKSGDSEASSPLRGAIQAPAIQLEGCTRDQREVARMMARLRGVEGATRVSLSESGTDDEQTEAANTSSGSAEEAPPCGPGSHPSFNVVVFFERDAELSAASNGQGTTPAATASSTASKGSAP